MRNDTANRALPFLLLLLAERDYEVGLITIIIDVLAQSEIDETVVRDKLATLKLKRDADIAVAESKIGVVFGG